MFVPLVTRMTRRKVWLVNMMNMKELKALSSRLISEPEDYMHSFRRNVSLYIDQKEITLQEVAELADISVSTLKSFLYGGSKDCNLSTAIKLARVFNVSVDELVGSGTIPPQTCNSLQTMRKLPDSFTHFVRWCINYHYDNINRHNMTERAIEVMQPTLGDGGTLQLTNHMKLLDISDLNDNIRPKIFMGIRIPNDMYAPIYFEGDILLIANDRNPFPNEIFIFSTADNMWLLKRQDKNNMITYNSIRDGRVIAKEKDIEHILGYVVKVCHEEELV